MKRLLTLLVVIGLGFVGPAYGQEGPLLEKKTKQYLCLAEQSAGFQYDEQEKKWVATIFRTEEKYIIRGAKPEDFKDLVDTFPGIKDFKNANYIVQEFGSPMVSYYCLGPYLNGNFFCKGYFGSFRFNNQSLRFQSSYDTGFVLPRNKLGTSAERENSPALSIGTCTPF